jgi:energy-coupling factor transporter ATP-binding protein EcfA2
MGLRSNSSLLLDQPAEAGHDSSNRLESQHRPARSRQNERFLPPPPQRLADLGLPDSLIEQLLFKLLYFRGDTMGGDLSRAIGLKFSLIQSMLDSFRMQHLIQVKSSLGIGPVSTVVALTEQGRKVARDYLDNNHYVGPAPVPVGQYTVAVHAQQMPPNWLRPERLAKAYSHMVVTENVLDQIGPAVSSGKSFLIYGQPGNGKTQLAEALARIQTTDIYIPYALEFQGNIIQLFDPIYHRPVPPLPDGESDGESDGRWLRCCRPFIATGGELSLAMLDLSLNPVSGIFDAPFQLKANNGIYLIDDFGRQRATPSEILNRWIVPMERHIDYLSFSNGGKMTVPFEAFLVFSTNLNPAELGGEAFVRRIQYKMLLRSPDETEFSTIFQEYCKMRDLPPHANPRLLEDFIDKHYRRTGKPFRRCHPRDVISQAIDYINFKRLPYELTDELLDRAFEGCFLAATESSEG